jgi:hypothetical protein
MQYKYDTSLFEVKNDSLVYKTKWRRDSWGDYGDSSLKLFYFAMAFVAFALWVNYMMIKKAQ